MVTDSSWNGNQGPSYTLSPCDCRVWRDQGGPGRGEEAGLLTLSFSPSGSSLPCPPVLPALVLEAVSGLVWANSASPRPALHRPLGPLPSSGWSSRPSEVKEGPWSHPPPSSESCLTALSRLPSPSLSSPHPCSSGENGLRLLTGKSQRWSSTHLLPTSLPLHGTNHHLWSDPFSPN